MSLLKEKFGGRKLASVETDEDVLSEAEAEAKPYYYGGYGYGIGLRTYGHGLGYGYGGLYYGK